jgi:cob(I)alamin adenosyltransferase
MVRLDRIYTRGGDKGQTSLGDGERLAKYAPRIEALGSVDEANAAIGVARLHTSALAGSDRHDSPDAMLVRIQTDLFDLGADLCVPAARGGKTALRIVQSQIDRLEHEIDQMNATLAPLTSFILPGGTPAAAHLHLARTLVRRAERVIAALTDAEGANPLALAYINRVSDHLFVLARTLNDQGRADVLWQPGANR